MDRKRLLRFAPLAAALLVAPMLLRRAPREQVVHYVLGDSAAHVEEIDARWRERQRGDGERVISDADGREQPDDWVRVASFRYPHGQAPRVVTHEPRLPDGDYVIEIEVIGEGTQRVVHRKVTLTGGVTSIDLATVGR
jgi:hypothetical protein